MDGGDDAEAAVREPLGQPSCAGDKLAPVGGRERLDGELSQEREIVNLLDGCARFQAGGAKPIGADAEKQFARVAQALRDDRPVVFGFLHSIANPGG